MIFGDNLRKIFQTCDDIKKLQENIEKIYKEEKNMTLLDKLMEIHPEYLEDGYEKWSHGCPHHYSFGEVFPPSCIGHGPRLGLCEECWNREIPENNKNIEKENNTMNDEKVCDLISEIEKKNEEIDRLIREKEALIEETERSKQKDELRDACVLINEHINAMVDGGFTREEAFAIFTKFLEKMI